MRPWVQASPSETNKNVPKVSASSKDSRAAEESFRVQIESGGWAQRTLIRGANTQGLSEIRASWSHCFITFL